MAKQRFINMGRFNYCPLKRSKMKKEEVYVVIDSEEKRLRAIQILSDAKENISTFDLSMDFSEKHKYLRLNSNNQWFIFSYVFSIDTEITLDQLEQMLNPIKEVGMSLDALKLIAESWGFELVEKEREIKVGDFGKFWDWREKDCCFGFLTEFEDRGFRDKFHDTSWNNFAHLTDEEKQQIQENW